MFKKTLIAVSVACASTCALADSQVNLYGTLDGAIAIQKAKGADTVTAFEDGIAGGSVWGLTGEEDLGNGYGINFTLENGFTVDNGANGEDGLQFGKQATLGVTGPFGEFAFGRMGGLSTYEGGYSIWDASPFGTDYLQAGLGSYGVFSGQILNNAMIYVTPEFDGLKGYLQYSNGVVDDANKWSKNDHYYGLGVTYESGNLNSSLIYEVYDVRESDQESTQAISFSVAYDFESVKPFFGYQYGNKLSSIVSSDEEIAVELTGKGANQHLFTLGAEVPLGGGTAKLAANYAFGKIKGDLGEASNDLEGKGDKFSKYGLGVAYEYPLSKRTFVYSWGAWQKGGKLLKTESIRSGYENWSLGLGLHHNF